ncbi:carboxylating nicotinate-nucleotide diphosphorylase [Oceaniserpentilla sp. 4NH20-0058]|uniref:carboxylating nicotinate-nucleotide diphosphorylase n=1 Tax=Oceaniserpentilla sp. 4NH20-0058 TaxID=3127660 RepID=UPI003109BC84
MNLTLEQIQPHIEHGVTQALAEDIGSGDITAQLIPADKTSHARIISRDNAVIAGCAWVNEVFKQLDSTVEIIWHVNDGQQVQANDTLFELKGSSRSLLTGERTALNFLQTLSAVATKCSHYSQQVKHTNVKLLDTRKTLPGMRYALKYAVTQGGCHNHRIGLFDAFLIKENHINACGSIAQAIAQAKVIAPNKPIEVEVESFDELNQALDAGADIIMLDNFSIEETKQAVEHAKGKAKLEASGGITDETLVSIAETGVDFISIGTLTKDVKAVDLSMRMV